jgi:aryl-alcohol dehydrogenase-like predicted oxidoreductase
MLGRFWPALPQETVDAVVEEALRGGVNWFDTAEGYGWGHSERSLHQALRAAEGLSAAPEPALVATKWWPLLRSARHLRRTVEERRKALGGRVIDLHQIHQRVAFSTLKAQMNALADLVAAGHTRAVGVSNFSASAMRRSAELLEGREVPLAANQVRYSLLDRRIEVNGVLDAARELGVTIIAYSPLAQGLLTGRFHPSAGGQAEIPAGARRRLPQFQSKRLRASTPVVRVVRDLAQDHECTPAQVALAWVTQRQPGLVVAIPGASTPRQARENAGAMAVRLTPEEIHRLDRVSDP